MRQSQANPARGPGLCSNFWMDRVSVSFVFGDRPNHGIPSQKQECGWFLCQQWYVYIYTYMFKKPPNRYSSEKLKWSQESKKVSVWLLEANLGAVWAKLRDGLSCKWYPWVDSSVTGVIRAVFQFSYGLKPVVQVCLRSWERKTWDAGDKFAISKMGQRPLLWSLATKLRD